MPLEIESKFYVGNLLTIEARLKTLGAACLVPRQLETNLRFDDDQRRLQAEHKILRLRRYDDFRLTFKSSKSQQQGVATRQEIEVSLSNFDESRALLEGLGFRVVFTYEKYRAMYTLEAASICLDELPFGHFVEIEAENPAKIARLTRALGLNPAAASAESYAGLFQTLKDARGLTAENLTFAELDGPPCTAADLGLEQADLPR